MTYRMATTDHDSKKLVPAGGTLDDLAEDLANKRTLLDSLKETVSAAQLDVDVAEAALFDALESQGLTAIKTPRGLFRLNDLAWAKIVDADAARTWAEANLPEIITLNASRLAVVVRQALKGGTPLPPGVDFSTSRKITWRKE